MCGIDTEAEKDVPVLHASELAGGLFEGDVVTGGKRAEAPGDDGDGAELCARRVHHVGTGGVLFSVVPIATLQVVVCASDGHLHAGTRGRERSMQSEEDSLGDHVEVTIPNYLTGLFQWMLSRQQRRNRINY